MAFGDVIWCPAMGFGTRGRTHRLNSSEGAGCDTFWFARVLEHPDDRVQRLHENQRLIAGLMFAGRSNFASRARARGPAQRLKQPKNGLFLCPDQS